MTRRQSPAAYTVFQSDGRTPRRTRIGLVAFTRRLREAVAMAEAGDIIQGWSSSGSPLRRYNARGRRIA